MAFCHLYWFKIFFTNAFKVKTLMIKWHNAQLVDFCVKFVFFINEYYGILVRVNKRHKMSKVLHCECSSSIIDDYIKHKLYGLH
jgi:hypothetical protein